MSEAITLIVTKDGVDNPNELKARIEALEECVREVVRRLDEIANWRNGAAAYDADVGNEPREFCEDVELIEGSAKDAADKARALLEEK